MVHVLLAAVVTLTLTVRETAGVARDGEMVRSGVPVARSLDVRAIERLAIVDAAGRAVPAEFDVLGRWNAGRRDATAPVQWLLVTFPASAGVYRLVLDGSVANPAPAVPLRVTTSGSVFTVDTGSATYVIDANAGSLFEEIRIAGATVARGGSMTVDDAAYASTRRAFIEHAGPLSATIVVEGTYGGPLSSTRRYTFSAGSATAIVRQSVANESTNAIRVRLIRDTLGNVAPTRVTITGARGSSVSGNSLVQTLRANRNAPPRYEIGTTVGAMADGATLATDPLAIALDHMHRFEPQALRALEDGSLAIDLAADHTWIGPRQALYATFAVGGGQALLPVLWASLNHPLRAWASPQAFADVVADVPVGPLLAEFKDYDRAVLQTLERTVERTDALGVYGLMSWGLFPRLWGNPIYSDEIDCGDDPTPQEAWDDLYWCATWTDYHNASMTAALRAMRTGEVQWLDEISRPAALRQLYTQIYQCAPNDEYFYCGQAPAGYGGYRADFNSSHAYFENLQLYYWLTGDRAVVETFARGARSMRAYLCTRRPCGPNDPPIDEYANLTGRVASQWNSTFRFLGLASDDASFLDDYRNNLARAVTQQYLALDSYGFILGGWRPVTSVSTHSTDQLWMTALYDTKNLEQLMRDTNDAPIGNPSVRPSDVLLRFARTLERYAKPQWPNQLDVTGSGARVGGSVVSVRATPGGSDPLLYDTGRATLAGPVARAAVQSNDPALLALARELTRQAIASSIADGSPLGKLQGEYLARLHAAVAALTPPPPPRRRSVRK